MTISSKITGVGAIALAVVFNLPYGYLAQHFGYPDILRRPAGEVLAAFAAGGDGLIWAWYVFGLSALAFVPLAIALSLTPERLKSSPAVAVGAALSGALAGLVQGMGLLRWVFVVPVLAQHPESAAAQGQFDLRMPMPAWRSGNIWGRFSRHFSLVWSLSCNGVSASGSARRWLA